MFLDSNVLLETHSKTSDMYTGYYMYKDIMAEKYGVSLEREHEIIYQNCYLLLNDISSKNDKNYLKVLYLLEQVIDSWRFGSSIEEEETLYKEAIKCIKKLRNGN